MLVIGLLGTFSLSLTNWSQATYRALLSWADAKPHDVGSAPLLRPIVLVITANREDQRRVALASVPRGYEVAFAETAEDGAKRLRSDAGHLAVVVIDSTVPGADRASAVARAVAPLARLVQLAPHHAAIEVSKPLVDAL